MELENKKEIPLLLKVIIQRALGRKLKHKEQSSSSFSDSIKLDQMLVLQFQKGAHSFPVFFDFLRVIESRRKPLLLAGRQ